MIIQIEGMNRTEFCKPKNKKDIDKRRFFETRGMLYRAYPDQFTRMRMYEYGKEVGTEEVIVYPENSIHPMIERGTHIDVDKILMDIDLNKTLSEGLFKRKAWGSLTSKAGSFLWAYGGLILCGLVLLYAFVSNGFQM